MKVKTTHIINKSPEHLWPLLCNSKMTNSAPVIFIYCVPKPKECKLKSGEGGVGNERQCISNKGIINQEITVWNVNKELRFEMKDTDMYFGECVTVIKEQFTLEDLSNNKTRITRTTDFTVNGWFQTGKSLLIWIGLKNVHRYVFKNWDSI
jgi:hypothetical protein